MRTRVVSWIRLLSLAAAGAAMVVTGPVSAGEAEPEQVLERWLVLGPLPAPLPALHDQAPGKVSLSDLLEHATLRAPGMLPMAGESLDLGVDGEATWTLQTGSPLELEPTEQSVAWLAGYLRTNRFVKLTLSVRSHHLLRIEVDGKSVAVKKGASPPESENGDAPEKKGKSGKNRKKASDSEPGNAEAELELDPGVHRVLIKALRDPGSPFPWTVAASVAGEDDPEVDSGIEWGTDPTHPVELAQILGAPQPTSMAVSPDGNLVATGIRRIRTGTEESESWVEIRRTGDGTLERTYRGASFSGIQWAPRGRRLSYVTRAEGKGSLWLADLEAATVQPILEGVEHLGSYRWLPDGTGLIYAVSVEAEKDSTGTQRLIGLQDRQARWRDRSYLHEVQIESGARRRLTAGELDTSLASISPDGQQLLFTRSVDDYSRRPYLREELWLLDRRTLEAERIHDGWFLRSAAWSPEGDRLLVMAGPSAFDGTGRAVPEGVIANDYDGQIYLMDPDGGNVEPLSRDFDPAIQRAFWHQGDGRVYLVVTEGSRVGLYRLDPVTRNYDRLDVGVDVIDDLDVARLAPMAVYSGSGVTTPPRTFAMDLDTGTSRLLDVPGRKAFRHVELGEVKDWSFRSQRGTEIQGRVYYPPGFDAERRWPAIIYYYGGTSPTSRSFGGRYPKNLWAAHGYVVYVLQPAGATGFGQEFSALHVNDWGNVAGGDIMEGVEKFLQAHPFVDPDRLGCIGASYGGFMTQYLLTRTERFAAGISHAGISFLGSYWGEGYWGYAYSGVASAESFPWNRQELYVESSPLFQADRIHTPLLLLHGSSDTNVPPGESEQLYTALKLLGREVEYVRIVGQDHHILKHAQRVFWSRSILAWFDRWLKGEPAWWDHLYPEVSAAADTGSTIGHNNASASRSMASTSAGESPRAKANPR